MNKAQNPHPTDLHVGQRVRARRQVLGLTQTQLADAVGVTFQQVQKYERGMNRISASMLYEIAVVLEQPVAAFFDGLPQPGQVQDDEETRLVSGLLAQPRGRAAAEAILALSARIQTRFLALARAARGA